MFEHVKFVAEEVLIMLSKLNSIISSKQTKKKIQSIEDILVFFIAVVSLFWMMSALTVHASAVDDVNDAVNIDKWTKESLDAARIMDTGEEGAMIVTNDKKPNVVTTRSIQFDSELITLAYKFGGTKPFEVTAEQRLAAEKLPYGVRYGITGVATTQMIYALYNQPAIDLSSYMAYEWSPVYHNKQELMAATYSNGYSFLRATGVAGLWGVTRNMSYLFLAIILVISGFMVMFRQKINGQVMVSIYNTIPNIIIALVLITFSFAIVGLLININTTVVYALARSFFPPEYREAYFDSVGGSFLSNFAIFMETAAYIISPVPAFTKLINKLPSGLSLGVNAFVSMGFLAAFAAIPVLGVIFGSQTFMGPLLLLISMLITLTAAIKIYFAMLKQYFMLLLNIILMPLAIAFGALPGQGHLTKNIFLKIIKNLLSMQFITFFVNLAMFLSTTPSLNISIFKGSYLGGGGNPALKGSGTSYIVRLYLFYYLLFFATNVPNLLDDWLKTDVAKGAEKAVQMTSQQMGKIPVLGSLFKKVS